MWRHLGIARTWRSLVSTSHNSSRYISTESQLSAYKFLHSRLTEDHTSPELDLSYRLIHGQSVKERLEAISQSDVSSTNAELRIAMTFLVNPGPLVEDLLLGGDESPRLPPWLLLYILHRSAGTKEQAQRIWELVRSCLSSTSSDMKCLLLISSAHMLADHGVEDALQELVTEVETFQEALSVSFWDLFLRVLLRLPRTERAKQCIARLLQSMASQKVTLIPKTLDLLLLPDVCNIDILLAIDQCIAAQGSMPSIQHTETFLRAIECLGKHQLSPAPPSSFIGEMTFSLDLPAFYDTELLVAASNGLELATHLRSANLLQWKWLYVAISPSMQEAFDRLQTLEATGARRDAEPPPEWLLLYLLRRRVHNEEDACVAFHLIDLYHHTATSSLRPGLLIITAYWCAKFDVIVFLRRIMQQFLFLSVKPDRSHFDYFLRALAYAPPSKETSVLIRTMLSATNSQTQSSGPVVDSLFGDVATLDVAEEVERNVTSKQGFTRSQLEALVILSARNRRRKKTGWYLRLLRQSLLQERPHLAPLGPDSMIQQSHGLRPHDRIYMQSFRRYRILQRYILLMARTHSSHSSRIMVNSRSPGKHSSSATTDLSSDVGDQLPPESGIEGQNGETLPSTSKEIPSSSSSTASPTRLSTKDWAATLYVASRDKAVTAGAFLSLYKKGIKGMSITPTSVTYHIVIRGLLKKGALEQALLMWREFCSSGHRLDTIILGLGVNVLIVNGLAAEAFALLEYVHSHQHKSTGHRGKIGRKAIFVNNIAVNSFLIGLSRIGRPDIVYQLWHNMEGLYNIRPDVYTLNIMLRTARWALKYNDSLRGTLTEMGFLRHPRSEMSQVGQPDRNKVVERIQGMLNPHSDHRVLGFWEGHSSGKVALRIAFDLFTNNWPELKNVETPVRALRRSSSSQLTAPISDVYHSFRGGPTTLPTLETALPALFKNTDSKMRYSRIVPTDVTFRLILDLLGAESLSAEIPLVLAWMRILNIMPSKNTLATAIVHWAEVSSDAPLIEALKGGGYHSPYERLIEWMTEWVGDGNMPQGQHIQSERKRVRYYKETSYRDMLDQARELSDDVD
ncbi:hypothetical protein QCA50_008068 [Cerrena zonata]|uniref:Pentatricopeptide repeat-containing protein n=1 Tax=Cerrena zonata TaxID=2478898 RepID=A0AAW0G4X3_9APHY